MLKRLFAVLVFFLIGIFVGRLSQPAPKLDTITNVVMGVESHSEKEKLSQSSYSIGIIYPKVIAGLPPEDTLRVNQIISGIVDKKIDGKKKEFRSIDRIITKGGTGPPLSEMWLGGDYRQERADTQVISVGMIFNEYSLGAHGMRYNEAINYSPKLHRALVLSDLFDKKSDYLPKLSQITREKLIEGYRRDDLQDAFTEKAFAVPGTTPEEKNFAKFLIGKDYLLVVYDPYEVGPYAYGIRQAKIPFSELRGYLNEDLL